MLTYNEYQKIMNFDTRSIVLGLRKTSEDIFNSLSCFNLEQVRMNLISLVLLAWSECADGIVTADFSTAFNKAFSANLLPNQILELWHDMRKSKYYVNAYSMFKNLSNGLKDNIASFASIFLILTNKVTYKIVTAGYDQVMYILKWKSSN